MSEKNLSLTKKLWMKPFAMAGLTAENDEIGKIGCDTLINQQDFIGVNLIAIQALEKRTTNLNEENAE